MENKEKSFEENLEKLENIVKDLESGDTPLDKAIDKYKEAIDIINICDKKLKNALEEITKIVNKDGNLEDFNVSE